MAGRARGSQGPLVRGLDRYRPVSHRAGVDRRSLGPVGGDRRLHRPPERGEEIDRPREALVAERDRLTAGYRALARGPGAGDVRREPRPGAPRRAAHAEPQLSHRAPPPHALLESHAHARRPPRGGRARARAGGPLLPQPLGGGSGALRRGQQLGAGQSRSPAPPARARRAPPRDRRGASRMGARAGARDGARAIGGIVSAQFGITMDTVRAWLASTPTRAPSGSSGVAASGGVAEGPARVVLHTDQLHEVRDGEILVCPATAPGGRRCSARSCGRIGRRRRDVARGDPLPRVRHARGAGNRSRDAKDPHGRSRAGRWRRGRGRGSRPGRRGVTR